MRELIKMSDREKFAARYVQADSLGQRFGHVMSKGRGATLFLLSSSDVDTIGHALLEYVKGMERIWGDPESPEPDGILAVYEEIERVAARQTAAYNLAPKPETSPNPTQESATVLQQDQSDGVATCA